MVIRLLLIAVLAAAAWYVLRRFYAVYRADPRLRYAMAGFGRQLLRILALRASIPLLLRLFRSFRIFW